jgi:hypothetical protein
MVAAVTAELNPGTWLPAGHFAVRTNFSAPLIKAKMQQSLQQNKTAGLVTLQGSEADGS